MVNIKFWKILKCTNVDLSISSYTCTANTPSRGRNGGRVYLNTRSPLFEHSAPPVVRNIIFERSPLSLPLSSATCSLSF